MVYKDSSQNADRPARSDSVVGDLNIFGAHFGAAFGDVAITNPLRLAQFFETAFDIERMHLESGHINQKARPDESIVHPMIAQHVADILAKKTLDAFPEFLHPIDVLVLHPPGAVPGIRRARLKLLDLFFT
jgi:hypothetical protein